MQQLQQQLAMNVVQLWQQQQQLPTQHYQNNNKNRKRGRKIRGNNNNNNNNRNGGGNPPTWSTNSNKFNRKNIPNNIRSNETPKCCWTHGHDTRRNTN